MLVELGCTRVDDISLLTVMPLRKHIRYSYNVLQTARRNLGNWNEVS